MIKANFEVTFLNMDDYKAAVRDLEHLLMRAESDDNIFDYEECESLRTKGELSDFVILTDDTILDGCTGKLVNAYGCYDYSGNYKSSQSHNVNEVPIFRVNGNKYYLVLEKDGSEFKSTMKKSFISTRTKIYQLAKTEKEDCFMLQDITTEYTNDITKLDPSEAIRLVMEQIYSGELVPTPEYIDDLCKNIEASCLLREHSKKGIIALSDFFRFKSEKELENCEHITVDLVIKIAKALTKKSTFQMAKDTFDNRYISSSAYTESIYYTLFGLPENVIKNAMANRQDIREISNLNYSNYFSNKFSFNVKDILNYDQSAVIVLTPTTFQDTTLEDIVERTLVLLTGRLYYNDINSNVITLAGLFACFEYIMQNELVGDDYKEAMIYISNTLGRITNIENLELDFFKSDDKSNKSRSLYKYGRETIKDYVNKEGRYMYSDLFALYWEGDDRSGTRAFEVSYKFMLNKGTNYYNYMLDTYVDCYSKTIIEENLSDSIKYFGLKKLRKALFNAALK